MSAKTPDMSRMTRNHVLLVSSGGARYRYRKLLRQAGFIVADAESSLSALSAATRTHRVGSQVVVVDLGIGETEALSLIEQLREELRDAAAQVIAVSDSDDPMLEVAAFGAGADDFVSGRNIDLTLTGRVRAHARIAERTAQLLMLAVRDELTGVHNRRGTLAALSAELDRARRSGRPVSLLLIDVDSFKMINDTHGHHAGDNVLIDLAARMRALLRSTDIVGRFGGDEFVVVLPEVDEALVGVLAMRVTQAAGEVQVGQHGKRINVSIGIATWDPKTGTDTADELIARADSGMYEKKRRKRRTTTDEKTLAA